MRSKSEPAKRKYVNFFRFDSLSPNRHLVVPALPIILPPTAHPHENPLPLAVKKRPPVLPVRDQSHHHSHPHLPLRHGPVLLVHGERRFH